VLEIVMTRSQSLLLALLVYALPAFAEPLVLQSPSAQVSLLELYTSEGCNSCPPADRWLSKLKADPRLWRHVVPVAFHVDYWDYLGWRDRFAAPAFSERQRRYAESEALSQVYTPGLILAGREWRQWFSRPQLKLEPGPAVGSLRLAVDKGQIEARFTPAAETRAEALELHVAVLGFGLESAVQAGENRGRTLTHDFVVLGYQHLELRPSTTGYQGQTALPPVREATAAKALAAWVSLPGDPRPLQAVGGWL
jgi:hypothetical protein